MPTVVIEDCEIQFPYEPYEVQKTYMKNVIRCIKEGKVGLLESPTGTGKTISLLCSTLAWISSNVADNDDYDYSKDFVSNPSTSPSHRTFKSRGQEQGWKTPHVVYACRTHSQLKEAVREFKASIYSRNVEMVVLGSREHMCLYPPVRNLISSDKMKCACEFYLSSKAILKNKDGSVKDLRCQYNTNYPSGFFTEPMDIEDLVAKSKKEMVCPYFASVSAIKNSIVIFCPYDYVLQEVFKKISSEDVNPDGQENELHIDLRESVIIFDEGHNLPSKFEEFASAKVNNVDLKACIKGIPKLNEEPNSSFQFHHALLGSLQKLLNIIESTVVKQSERVGILEADFTPEETLNISRQFGGVSENLNDVSSLNEESVDVVALLKLVGKFFNRMEMFPLHPNSSFRLHLEEKTVESKAEQTKVRTLEFWCADPSITMEKVQASGTRAIIITSGTLAPLSVFKSDLGISDAIELRNSHVIQNYQVFGRMVFCGPDGVYFNSSYRTRFNEDYLNSIGLSILKVSLIAKHKGVLVVFPSYEMLESCKTNWLKENTKGISVWSQLTEKKEIYLELKSNVDFEQTLKKFKSCISEKRSEGAVLLGVFRGKIAEGLDLKDDFGRVVILVGIPYRPRSDPRIKFKLDFLRDKKMINENQWYVEDAMRTANQAMGRVIRHIRDYGAILLFDYRFRVDYLPGWLSHLMHSERRFYDLTHQLEQFFNDVEERVKAHHDKQQHHGNYRGWEVKRALVERQDILRENERLSRQMMYLNSMVRKLTIEKADLESKLKNLNDKYGGLFNEFDQPYEMEVCEQDSGDPPDVEVLQNPNSDTPRSQVVPYRKRQHSPELPS